MIRLGMFLVLLALVPACDRKPEGTRTTYPAAVKPPPEPARPQPPEANDRIPMPREVVRRPLAVDGSRTHEGRRLFLKLQCIDCHTGAANAKGPALEGLFGTQVALTDGQVVFADEEYISESIREPKAKVVRRWEPIMPAYNDKHASADEVKALVAYIQSLRKGDLKPKNGAFPRPVGASK